MLKTASDQLVPKHTEIKPELRQRALDALQCADFDQKPALVTEFIHSVATFYIAPDAVLQPLGELPGRPALPLLVPPIEVPRRSPFTRLGRAALVHSVAHIEWNAINLALDAIWRFPGMPMAYYTDWARVAGEEAQHFLMLRALLQHMGHDYGDFCAHDGLWSMTERTKDDITARMALVPRTLEARGLDATPIIQAKLREVASKASRGDPLAVDDSCRVCAVLDVILEEEIGHVAIGNRWYRHLCEVQGIDPVAHYAELATRYQAPRLKPPFNLEARIRAGFAPDELACLM